MSLPSDITKLQFSRIRFYKDGAKVWDGATMEGAPLGCTHVVLESPSLADGKPFYFPLAAAGEPLVIRLATPEDMPDEAKAG